MSAQNVELLHQAIDAFNRRDLEAFLALMDPGVESPHTNERSRASAPTAAMRASRPGGKRLSRPCRTSARSSTRY